MGATLVSKNQLFQDADVVSILLVLSDRTRGVVGTSELALMKPNGAPHEHLARTTWSMTSSLRRLSSKKIAGAAIDVFEPRAIAARPSVPKAAEPAGDAPYRLRIPQAVSALLPGHGRQHPPVAGQPSGVITCSAPGNLKMRLQNACIPNSASASRRTSNDSTPQSGRTGSTAASRSLPVAPCVPKPAGPFEIVFHHRDLKTAADVDCVEKLCLIADKALILFCWVLGDSADVRATKRHQDLCSWRSQR